MQLPKLWSLGIAMPAALAFAFDASAAALSRASEAEAHFRLGVRRYEESHYDDAIEEFTRAYEASGDFRYLFNLAQAHAVRWRPVEALALFEKYLKEGGSRVSAQRRALVLESIAQQRMRTATLELNIRPHGALVTVDGRRVGRSPLSKPLQVASGEHIVSVLLDGYQTVEQEIKLKGQEAEVLELSLRQDTSLPKPSLQTRVGHLALDCALPDIKVFVDRRQLPGVPSASNLLVEEGTHELRLERTGYRTQVKAIHVSASEITRVACDLPVAEPLNPEEAGTLKLESATAGVVLSVDGVPHPSVTLVPTGLHSVEVRRFGFLPWRGQIRIASRETQRLWVSLRPTPEYDEELRSRAQVRRNWSYGLAAVGTVSLGAALGLGFWNHRRHNAWEREESYLQGRFDEGIYTQELERRRRGANDLLQSVQSIDIVTAGLAVASGLTLAGAAVLFFGGEKPSTGSEWRKESWSSERDASREFTKGGVWRDTIQSSRQ